MIHPEERVQVYTNYTTAVFCVGYGKPVPYIAWSRNGSEMTNNSRVTISEKLVTDDSGTIYVKSTIEFCDSRVSDSGEYSCTADNGAGQDSFLFELQVIVEGD